MEKTHKQSRYIFLDLIRILATLMIVWFHIALTLQLPGNDGLVFPRLYYFSLGNIGVSIFIILSGIVLQLRYQQQNLHAKSFFVKRWKKIYSTFIVCFVVLLLIRVFKNLTFLQTFWFSCPECTVINTSCSILGICSLVGQWGGPFARTSWFIGLILSLYLIYPFIRSWVIQSRYSLLFLLIISLASRLITTRLPFLTGTPLEWFPINRLFEFALGIKLAYPFLRSSLSQFNLSSRINALIISVSELTFPLFLIHYELDFLLIQMRGRGYSHTEAIIWYSVVSCFIAYLCYFVSQIFSQRDLLKSAKNFVYSISQRS